MQLLGRALLQQTTHMEHIVNLPSDTVIVWADIFFEVLKQHAFHKGERPKNIFVDVDRRIMITKDFYHKHGPVDPDQPIRYFNAEVYFAYDLGNKIVTA